MGFFLSASSYWSVLAIETFCWEEFWLLFWKTAVLTLHSLSGALQGWEVKGGVA